jgi:hypothetical protein
MNIFIERFLLAILAALAVLLAVTNPMQFSVTSRIIGVIIIFILAGIAAYCSELIQRRRVQREQARHDEREVKAMPIVAIPAAPAPLAAQPEVKKEERIFVGQGITPEYLLDFFEQHTAVQATNAIKDYIGKWMKVAGSVNNVISTSDFLARVTFERQPALPDYTYLYMSFRGPWKDRAKILKRGDNITVIGQIRQIEPMALNLDNCEFNGSNCQIDLCAAQLLS